MTQTRYFNIRFVFLRHKIQTDIKQKKKVEKITEKLQFFFKKNFEKFFLKWVEPGPNILGWAGSAGPCKQWVSPLFTCNVNSGETRRRRRRRKGKGRRLTYGGSQCFWRLWRWQRCCWVEGDQRWSFFFSFFLFCFSLLFFLCSSVSFFSQFSFFSFGLQTFFSLVLPPSPFFALFSPVFIGKTVEREVGAATVQSPQK